MLRFYHQPPALPPAVAIYQAAAKALLQNLPADYSKEERHYASAILEKIKNSKEAHTFHVAASGVAFDRQKVILRQLKEAFF